MRWIATQGGGTSLGDKRRMGFTGMLFVVAAVVWAIALLVGLKRKFVSRTHGISLATGIGPALIGFGALAVSADRGLVEVVLLPIHLIACGSYYLFTWSRSEPSPTMLTSWNELWGIFFVIAYVGGIIAFVNPWIATHAAMPEAIRLALALNVLAYAGLWIVPSLRRRMAHRRPRVAEAVFTFAASVAAGLALAVPSLILTFVPLPQRWTALLEWCGICLGIGGIAALASYLWKRLSVLLGLAITSPERRGRRSRGEA